MTVRNEELNKKDYIKNHLSLMERLVNFGLTKYESLVYIYLLEKGKESGGSKIALGTNLHRQYVYIALPKLIELGLVEEIYRGKLAKYKACSPQIIESLGRRKSLEAIDLAKELSTISNIGNEQDFEVLQGAQAIQEYELQYASAADREEEEYIIGGSTSSYAELMNDILDEYLKIKENKKTKVKYIGAADERKYYEKYIGKFENQEYRFMDKLPKGKTHMLIRKNTVSFFTFLNPPLVYIVKSPIIASNYRDFFMMLWDYAK